jgi:hypothetical protein
MTAAGAPRPGPQENAQAQDVLGLDERERAALLAWVGENLTLVRQSASGQRIQSWILAIGFVVGLGAHIGGFLLKTWATTEPLLVLADLIYALGWAMWTGVVVVLFVQIWPEAKKREYKQALDAYEAAVARPAGAAGSGEAGAGGGAAGAEAGAALRPDDDWQAAIAAAAAAIRDLDPLAGDYDDKLETLRAKLREHQGSPAAGATDAATDPAAGAPATKAATPAPGPSAG